MVTESLSALDSWAQRLLWLPRLFLVATAFVVVLFALERDPPYEVLGIAPVAAQRGSVAVVHMQVRRDVTRQCSVDLSRYLLDSAGVVHELPHTGASHEALVQIERASPGKASVAVEIPDTAALGPGALVTSRAYVCNPVHAWWPIRYTTSAVIEVLPRTPR